MFNNKYLLFQLLTILLNWGICYGRVVYIQIHGEKPGIGCMDDASSQLKVMSSMDGLGDPQDGLGYTGMIRASCMTQNFGPNAPYYRRPKRIITQHFLLQNNGDFINNGHRGHHTSRRMYHQTYALALSLGIDPDAETCCGGSFDDIINYIYTLPPEDDPILVVNQHGVCYSLIEALALSFGQSVDVGKFGKDEDRVWTMIDGKFVEEWFMCCPGITNKQKARCSQGEPAWVSSYNFPNQQQKPPIVREPEYPSFIFTPSNERNSIGWNYNSYLRKRGVWSGEECFNEDLVKPYVNTTDFDNFDLRKRDNKQQKEQNNETADNEKDDKSNKDEINDEENSSILNKINGIIIPGILLVILLFIL